MLKTYAKKFDMENLSRVVGTMRQRDKDEIYATTWTNSSVKFTERMMALSLGMGGGGAYARIIVHEGEPVCAVGAIEARPGVWSAFMFASDNFHKVQLFVTKYVRQRIMPYVVEQGAHRVECQSKADYLEAHEWLRRSLGAEGESILKGYGKNGEDFVTFVRHF